MASGRLCLPHCLFGKSLDIHLASMVPLFGSAGLCNASYVIAWIKKKIFGFQTDDVYFGTTECSEGGAEHSLDLCPKTRSFLACSTLPHNVHDKCNKDPSQCQKVESTGSVCVNETECTDNTS